MASSRPLRKSSRMSSPMTFTVKSSYLQNEGLNDLREEPIKTTVWEEPPPREPAPSFEDYKGLERHGVLEHMAPLGTLPSQKVKLRLKSHGPMRRHFQGRNGEITAVKEESSLPAPEPTSLSIQRQPEHRKPDERISRLSSTREREEDQDYTPKGLPKGTPVKAATAQSPHLVSPISRTPGGREKLSQIVDSAVRRSHDTGDPVTGLAIKKLFNESLQDRTLADILDAVLSQQQTERQAAAFQRYIKMAKKDIKAEARRSTRGSGSVSKSPQITRPTSSRNSERTKNNTNTTAPNDVENSHAMSSNEAAKITEDTGSSTREDLPAKRIKRSRSASNSSSLSSLTSLDRDFTPSLEIDQSSYPIFDASAPSATSSAAQTQTVRGPKMHTYSISRTTNPPNKESPTITTATNDEDAEELARKRRKFQRSFDDYVVKDSGIRSSPKPKNRAGSSSVLSGLRPPKIHEDLRNGTSKTIRDDNDELQSLGSSNLGDLLIPPPAGAQSSSRSTTPHQLSRPLKQAKKVARIKMSPMKKKYGVIAGVARIGGGRDISIVRADENGVPDNVDFCVACSGNGQLLCCDGCTRAFHFTCLDPPIDPHKPVEGEWFCHICEVRRRSPVELTRGVFSGLITNIDKKNPNAYYLPHEVRDFFEGVRTGDEGEYEELGPPKVRVRPGHEETPNYFKLKDAKENPILCYYCGKSAEGKRAIISCTYCSLHWHLDCLDPPLAIPPVFKAPWRCPNHINLERQTLQPRCRSSNSEPAATLDTADSNNFGRRSLKVRKPKHPRIIETSLRRGHENNGFIEITNESSDTELEREDSSGVIYSLPERGIVLDFIDRMKRSNEIERQNARAFSNEARRSHHAPRIGARPQEIKRLKILGSNEQQKVGTLRLRNETRHQIREDIFDGHSFLDRKVALNLAQFSQSNPDLNLGFDQVENLVGTLIAEAPPDVVNLLSKAEEVGSKDPEAREDASTTAATLDCNNSLADLSNSEKKILLALQELISRRLAGSAK